MLMRDQMAAAERHEIALSQEQSAITEKPLCGSTEKWMVRSERMDWRQGPTVAMNTVPLGCLRCTLTTSMQSARQPRLKTYLKTQGLGGADILTSCNCMAIEG